MKTVVVLEDGSCGLFPLLQKTFPQLNVINEVSLEKQVILLLHHGNGTEKIRPETIDIAVTEHDNHSDIQFLSEQEIPTVVCGRSPLDTITISGKTGQKSSRWKRY